MLDPWYRGDWYSSRRHEITRVDLVAHRRDGVRWRTDPDEPVRHHGAGKVRVLGEEAVPGMDRRGAGRLGRREYGVDIAVGLGRVGGPDRERLVGFGDERQARVGLGIDRGRFGCRAGEQS
jgi:hypothetical protein